MMAEVGVNSMGMMGIWVFNRNDGGAGLPILGTANDDDDLLAEEASGA